MLIAVLYQLLLVIREPILLGGFKIGDEVLDPQDWEPCLLETVLMESSSWMASINAKYS